MSAGGFYQSGHDAIARVKLVAEFLRLLQMNVCQVRDCNDNQDNMIEKSVQ